MLASNVLVTGASGFIGVHLVARLLSEGSRVTVLVRSSSALPREWHDRVNVVACDDFSERGLRRLIRAPVDTVFHLAAYGVRPNLRGCVGAALRRMARADGNGGDILGISEPVEPGPAY